MTSKYVIHQGYVEKVTEKEKIILIAEMFKVKDTFCNTSTYVIRRCEATSCEG